MSRPPRLSLVTVSSDDFVPGTIAMLHSFSVFHPEIAADFVVIHDDLSPRSINRLTALFPTIAFRPVSRDLRERLDRLCSELPEFTSRRRRFLSVETMLSTGYDKVLFCDSDIIFQGSIDPALQSISPLVCCGDIAFLDKTGRDTVTFSKATHSAVPRLMKTFNAGLMVFNGDLCIESNRAALLSAINPKRWKDIATKHTDQILFNWQFNGLQEIVGPEFNYLLGHRDQIRRCTGARAEEARVLHFNGPQKPWLVPSSPGPTRQSRSGFDPLQEWRRVYDAAIRRSGEDT
ncbi:glycosyltransferase [Citromicrobium bathyomarinum]|uniref:glycosyltransferase family 8 protein n=1 Tax=Citromicrobium bathyomarinum TaxID=72174 RepID=UPI00315AFD4A